MAVGKFSIASEDFGAKSAEHFRGLVGSPEFADVTLVSQDHQRIPAHRVILSSGCSFFREVLAAEPSAQRPLLYLRGISSEVLEALVTFLYTGRADVEQVLLRQFMAVGEDLGVVGLVKDMGVYTGGDGEYSTEDIAEKVFVEEKVTHAVKPEPIDFKNSTKLGKPSGHPLTKGTRTNRKFNPNEKKIICPKKSQDGTYQCPFCARKVRDMSNMRRHLQKHDNIEFPCSKCDHIANTEYNLRNHMKRSH
jgi:hypothetical protein